MGKMIKYHHKPLRKFLKIQKTGNKYTEEENKIVIYIKVPSLTQQIVNMKKKKKKIVHRLYESECNTRLIAVELSRCSQ